MNLHHRSSRSPSDVLFSWFCLYSQQEKVDTGPKRDIDGMGVPEIKYGDSVCFVMHVATGLWLSYLAPDAKSSRLGPLKRRVKNVTNEDSLDSDKTAVQPKVTTVLHQANSRDLSVDLLQTKKSAFMFSGFQQGHFLFPLLCRNIKCKVAVISYGFMINNQFIFIRLNELNQLLFFKRQKFIEKCIKWNEIADPSKERRQPEGQPSKTNKALN